MGVKRLRLLVCNVWCCQAWVLGLWRLLFRQWVFGRLVHTLVKTISGMGGSLSFGLENGPLLFSEGFVKVDCGSLTSFVGAVFEPANGFFYLVNKCLAAGW